MFELTFHPGGRGLEIASSVVLNSAGSAEMIKRISASSRVNVIWGASEASDTRAMVSGANACRRPSGTFSTPAATRTDWIDPRSIGRQQDLDVALRFVVDHEGPDRALLRERRRGDEQRRGDNRS